MTPTGQVATTKWTSKAKLQCNNDLTLTLMLNRTKASNTCSSWRSKGRSKVWSCKMEWCRLTTIKWISIRWSKCNHKWAKGSFKNPSSKIASFSIKASKHQWIRACLEPSINSNMVPSNCLWCISTLINKTQIQNFCPNWRTSKEMFLFKMTSKISLIISESKLMSKSILTKALANKCSRTQIRLSPRWAKC